MGILKDSYVPHDSYIIINNITIFFSIELTLFFWNYNGCNIKEKKKSSVFL